MDSYFAFSLHKAGSTLLSNLLDTAAQTSQLVVVPVRRMSYVSLPDHLFNAGVRSEVLFDKNFVSPMPLDAKDTIYGGFRFVPAFIDDRHLKNAGVMILVRDPRDILTSLYYSIVKSHTLPPGTAGEMMRGFRDDSSKIAIDDFVLEQARHENWVDRFERITSFREKGKAWRYEDVIFEKGRWFDEILEYLKMDLPRARREELVARENQIPSQEQPDAHIRQVTPGDHRRKLKPQTIEELNERFKYFIDSWGYSK